MASATWQTIASPVDSTLNDVAAIEQDAYAVGNGGTLLSRKPPGDWTVQIETGVAGDGRNLRSVDATDGGNRIWFAGDGGAFGYYVPASKSAIDLSGPNGHSASFTGLVVVGEAGGERVYAADANGRIVNARVTSDGVEFGTTLTPNGGNGGVTGMDADADTALVGCDTTGALFRSTDGVNWRSDGVTDTQFVGVAADSRRYHAVTDNGTLYEHRFYGGDGNGQTTSEETGADTAHDVAVDRGEMLVTGTTGRIHERAAGGWQTHELEENVSLRGVATGKLDVVVGANGTIAER